MSTRAASGFTLIEMLLSIAALAIIAGIGVPVYQSLQVRNNLDIAATTLAQDYRRAQTLAQASDGDTSWGVSVGSTTITVFKGLSYATRDASYDELSDLSGSITPTGVLSVVFAKFTGLPQTTGTTTLTSNTNEVRTVYLNAKGTITY